MELEHVLTNLTVGGELISAPKAEYTLQEKAGLYAIYIDDSSNLPEPFATYLKKQDTTLIYLGKTSKSLFVRLFKQDLRHKNPSTFFRAIGPILGFWPPRGSLVGYRNQKNYKFSPADTQAIISWINEHLSVRYMYMTDAPSCEILSLEAKAIATLKPLLNTLHNPEALPELASLRTKCRNIACAKES